MTYFPWVFRANSNAKLWSDEGVVDEAGDILKWLPIILAGKEKMGAAKLNANQIQTMYIFLDKWSHKTYLR